MAKKSDWGEPLPFFDCSCEWIIRMDRPLRMVQLDESTIAVRCPEDPPPDYKLMPYIDKDRFRIIFHRVPKLRK